MWTAQIALNVRITLKSRRVELRFGLTEVCVDKKRQDVTIMILDVKHQTVKMSVWYYVSIQIWPHGACAIYVALYWPYQQSGNIYRWLSDQLAFLYWLPIGQNQGVCRCLYRLPRKTAATGSTRLLETSLTTAVSHNMQSKLFEMWSQVTVAGTARLSKRRV